MSRSVRELQAALATLVGAAGVVPPVGPECIALAARNGVAALLHTAGERGGWIDALTETRRERLETARRREIAQQLKVEGHAEQLLRALRGVGVEVLALKGLALNHSLYGPLGWVRAPGDIDLLVSRDDFPRVREVYADLGFEPYRKHPPGFYDDHHHMRPHHPPGDRSLLVDVHWTPIRVPNPYRFHLDECWKRAVPLSDEPSFAGVLRLDDLDFAVHVALQMDFDDAYGGKGRSLFDLAVWISRRALDPQALRERAAECGGAEAFSRVAAILARTFHVDLGARATIRGVPTGWWEWAVQRALWLPVEPHAMPAWYRQHLARSFTHARSLREAVIVSLEPVWSNRRLGGGGFRAD